VTSSAASKHGGADPEVVVNVTIEPPRATDLAGEIFVRARRISPQAPEVQFRRSGGAVAPRAGAVHGRAVESCTSCTGSEEPRRSRNGQTSLGATFKPMLEKMGPGDQPSVPLRVLVWMSAAALLATAPASYRPLPLRESASSGRARCETGCEPLHGPSAVQSRAATGAEPARGRKHNLTIMFSEARARAASSPRRRSFCSGAGVGLGLFASVGIALDTGGSVATAAPTSAAK
jgi:hypothetical protein